jgi:hypothetical protein
MILAPNGLAVQKPQELSELEMQWLAFGEDVCRKLGVTLACVRCLSAGNRQGAILRGNNDPQDAVMRVECDCRQMTYRQKAD